MSSNDSSCDTGMMDWPVNCMNSLSFFERRLFWRIVMKEWKLDYRAADIQDGAIHKIGKYNFPQHKLATRNQNGSSSLGYKNLNLIQT